MNIDERCYGYEPAQTQLNNLRQNLKRYQWLYRKMRSAAITAVGPVSMAWDEVDRRIAEEEAVMRTLKNATPDLPTEA